MTQTIGPFMSGHPDTTGKDQPKRPKRIGIIDYEDKWKVIHALAGGGTDQNIAKWLLTDSKKAETIAQEKRDARKTHNPGASEADLKLCYKSAFAAEVENQTEDAADLAGSFKSYNTSKPTGKRGHVFVKCVVDRLKEKGCNDIGLEESFINFPYRDFLNRLSGTVRDALLVQTESEDNVLHQALLHRNLSLDRIKISQGRLDQKLYYLNPDSAHTWNDLINAGQYKTYIECSDSLEKFVSNDDDNWTIPVSKAEITNIVMLGGGGPSKDLLILNSVLENCTCNERINYTIVDISSHMLMGAFQIVDKNLIIQGRRNRVNLVPVLSDFMELPAAKWQLRPKGKRVVWFLPGATLGNLNENAFFRAIKQLTEAGDILVIGAETIGEGPDPNAILATYASPAVREFLSTPLRAGWHALGLGGSLGAALKELKIEAVSGTATGHSTVPDSVVIEIAIHINGRKIVLITSARYDEMRLCEAARPFGFVYKTAIPSRRNPNYKQFVFQFVPD